MSDHAALGALRLAMGELQACVEIHRQRCLKDRGHEHEVFRRLLRAQQIIGDAHDAALIEPEERPTSQPEELLPFCEYCGGGGMAPYGEAGDSCQACRGLGRRHPDPEPTTPIERMVADAADREGIQAAYLCARVTYDQVPALLSEVRRLREERQAWLIRESELESDIAHGINVYRKAVDKAEKAEADNQRLHARLAEARRDAIEDAARLGERHAGTCPVDAGPVNGPRVRGSATRG